MSCDDNVCGTGGWTGPKPGDPDNFIALRAATVYGGIEITFTYPATNPFAVAFVHLYRSLTPDFTEAAERALMAGNVFFDRIDTEVDVEYYYWVQIVSVNGTVMDPIGPSSAIARPKRLQTLEELTQQIDTSQLAIDLKTHISGITKNNDAILKEIQDRLLANQGFADALKQVQDGLTDSVYYITHEVTGRKDGDNALAQAIDIVAAANRDNLAAIEQERIARVTADDAMAQDITTLIAKVGDNASGIIHDVQVVTDLAHSTATDVETLVSKMGDANAGLIHDMETLATQQGALAFDLTTVEASLNGDVATGKVGLITQVGDIDGKVGQLSAEYFAKVEVNGLIGGFGLYNDGIAVDAGFDVDRFWIGRTNANRVKPFIVSGGAVYMDKAIIRNADIDALKIAGSAVTVPIAARAAPNLSGTGYLNWQRLIAGYIKLDEPGIVYAHCISFQRYGKGIRKWQLRISINGVTGSSVGGQDVTTTPVIAQSLGCPAGVIPVIVDWCGEDSGVGVVNTDLFIMGAKR